MTDKQAKIWEYTLSLGKFKYMLKYIIGLLVLGFFLNSLYFYVKFKQLWLFERYWPGMLIIAVAAVVTGLRQWKKSNDDYEKYLQAKSDFEKSMAE